MKNALSITVTLFSLIASSAVMADDTTSTKVDLDKRGDRIEQRLDNKGDRIEQRLDNRGDRIDNHYDRKGERINNRLDHRAKRK